MKTYINCKYVNQKPRLQTAVQNPIQAHNRFKLNIQVQYIIRYVDILRVIKSYTPDYALNNITIYRQSVSVR